ncbi:nucleoside-diphosphate-sugar epimerase [Colletotrichum asianum]|uniref:Nucleoside-diphosphate-sugar epimerase n=1 Tax=Colletotrichum asianum TaxID=702518 RepID=A0A8H3VUU3_9PEZI|nr:nucleoside-diphosphate-sugar epimerase [Colletotrichum asianum]
MPAQPVPVRILLIGASGYIGGSILSHLRSVSNAATLRVSALVRSPSAVETITTSYPEVHILLGDLSNEKLLYDAATVSDIIIYAARNTQEGIKSLLAGLAATKAGDGHDEQHDVGRRPTLFIMLSAIISLADPKNLRLGEPPNGRSMSDVADLDTIMALPTHHWHVAQERAFLQLVAAEGKGNITAVIMGLPFAVGNGTGLVRTRGFVHNYVDAVLCRQDRCPFMLGNGRNTWSWGSPQDLASAVYFIVDRWKRDESRQSLGGYFFVEAGQLEMGDLARHAGGTIQSAQSAVNGADNGTSRGMDCESLQYPQFAELMPELPGLWGVSAQCRADRLRNMGWAPNHTEWKPLVEACVIARLRR